MGDKERLVFYVNEETAESFRKQVAEMYGKADGNMSLAGENALREWTDKDRAARIEDKLDEVLTHLDEKPDERERNPEVSSEMGPRIQDRYDSIVHDLPEKTWIGDDVVERCIAKHAGDTDDTFRRYKRNLKQHGELIELPEGVDGPDGERYATHPRTWALRAENDDRIKPAHIDAVVGELEPALGEDWYLDALPDDYIKHNQLCYDEIPALSSLDYQEAHNLTNGHHPEA